MFAYMHSSSCLHVMISVRHFYLYTSEVWGGVFTAPESAPWRSWIDNLMRAIMVVSADTMLCRLAGGLYAYYKFKLWSSTPFSDMRIRATIYLPILWFLGILGLFQLQFLCCRQVLRFLQIGIFLEPLTTRVMICMQRWCQCKARIV